MEIKVLEVGPSSVCDGLVGAVDATVRVGDIVGEVTLLPMEAHPHILGSWGELSHWASSTLHGLDRDVLEDIVTAVASAAEEAL